MTDQKKPASRKTAGRDNKQGKNTNRCKMGNSCLSDEECRFPRKHPDPLAPSNPSATGAATAQKEAGGYLPVRLCALPGLCFAR